LQVVAPNVWEPIAKDPASAVSLIDEFRERLVREGRRAEVEHLESPEEFLDHVLKHVPEGALLRDGEGRAIGMAMMQSISGLGRMVEFFAVRESHLTPSGLKEFLECLFSNYQKTSPVLILWDNFRMLDTQPLFSFLGERGFHRFNRYEMIFSAGRALPPSPLDAKTPGRIRNVGPGDLEALSRLNAICFSGSIDSYLLATTNDQLENARELMRDLINGKYGRFMEEASFGLEVDGEVVGTSIITRNADYTLLADVAVHPGYRSKGHARRLIRASLEVLLREPGIPLYLNVTRENSHAFRLYRALGFEVKSGPYPLWAHTEGLGISPPQPVEDDD
jgi:ribosomal protein S18 acetylase RimI-like enzyme